MRASEFVMETQRARISRRQQSGTRGLNIFSNGPYDKLYDLNRVMMAAASTDGTFVPDIDAESWSGKYNTAHPYTKQEQAMLQQAYRAAGIASHDLNHGDMDSEEHPGGNTASPIKGFRGYPR
jgi:hypothetical protein